MASHDNFTLQGQRILSILRSLSSINNPMQIKTSKSLSELWQIVSENQVVLYSPVSRFIYQYEGETGGFIQALSRAVDDTREGHDDSVYDRMQKILDHMELATLQKINLQQQQDKIEDQRKRLHNLQKVSKKLSSANRKMTIDFITILGIFTSITFATFGGLQLLGNVFGKIKHLTHNDVGSEMMLGAVFLFGTYLILVALLTGISKLVEREYRTSFPTRYLMVGGFAIVFILGFFYANEQLVPWVVVHWKISLAFLLIVFVAPLVCDVFIYQRKKHK